MAIESKYKKRGSNISLIVMLAVLIALVVAIIMWPFGAEAEAEEVATEQVAVDVEAEAEAEPAEEPKSEEEDVEATTLVNVGDVAPDFTVTMLDGRTIKLSELRGNVVMVCFWATWCPPCREELKHVQKEIIDRFKGKDFVFLPISRGEKKATVEAFREKNGYKFAMGLDPNQSIFKLFASNYIPRNFLIGKDGKIIYLSVGYDEKEFQELISAIDKALK